MPPESFPRTLSEPGQVGSMMIIPDITEITNPETHPLLDKCWADSITFAGVAAAVIASHKINQGKFKSGAVFAGISAIADYFDGKEARRFARRHPEAAAERQDYGEFNDQLGDRARNTLIGGSIALSTEIPTRARIIAGAVASAEGMKIIGGASIITHHKIQGRQGLPEFPPSSPVGKESMWWIGTGLVGVLGGTALKDRSPQSSRRLEITGMGLLAGGLVRMFHAGKEYYTHTKNVRAAQAEGKDAPEPNYNPHLGNKLRNVLAK